MSLVEFRTRRVVMAQTWRPVTALEVLRWAMAQLTRLLEFLVAHNIPWDGTFGRLTELNAFASLMQVHNDALAKGTEARPGFCAFRFQFGAYACFSTLCVPQPGVATAAFTSTAFPPKMTPKSHQTKHSTPHRRGEPRSPGGAQVLRCSLIAEFYLVYSITTFIRDLHLEFRDHTRAQMQHLCAPLRGA